MDKLNIGKIVNTFGLKGELKVISQSEFIEDRFKVGNTIFIDFNNDFVPVTITTMRTHQGNVLLSVDDLLDINLIEKYKGCDVYIAKKDIPRLDGDYYLFELEGLDVYVDNQKIGFVLKAEKPSAQTLLRIQTPEKVVLIPFVDQFIKNVDIDNKRLDIEVIEGLLWTLVF